MRIVLLNCARATFVAVAWLAAFGAAPVFELSSASAADLVASNRTVFFENGVKPFLAKYCAGCHGADVQKAEFAVHEITKGDLGHWEKIAENVSLELMPPPEKPQPTREQRDAFVDWIRAHLKASVIHEMNRRKTSDQGNRVGHEDLYSGKHKGPAYSSSRLWRISQRIYHSISKDMRATQGHAGPVAGQEYQLSLAFAGRPGTTAADNVLGIDVTDSSSNSLLSQTLTTAPLGWNTHTFTFTATTAQTKLAFADEGTSNSLGTFLDDVQVTPVTTAAASSSGAPLIAFAPGSVQESSSSSEDNVAKPASGEAAAPVVNDLNAALLTLIRAGELRNQRPASLDPHSEEYADTVDELFGNEEALAELLSSNSVTAA